MRLGDVFEWATPKAKGHDLRTKFHVFICRQGRESTFLFVSSEDFGGDFEITNPPHEFLWKGNGYICTRSVVTYTDDELDGFAEEPVGRLTDDDITGLNFAISNSFSMEQGHIRLICGEIAKRFA